MISPGTQIPESKVYLLARIERKVKTNVRREETLFGFRVIVVPEIRNGYFGPIPPDKTGFVIKNAR